MKLSLVLSRDASASKNLNLYLIQDLPACVSLQWRPSWDFNYSEKKRQIIAFLKSQIFVWCPLHMQNCQISVMPCCPLQLYWKNPKYIMLQWFSSRVLGQQCLRRISANSCHGWGTERMPGQTGQAWCGLGAKAGWAAHLCWSLDRAHHHTELDSIAVSVFALLFQYLHCIFGWVVPYALSYCLWFSYWHHQLALSLYLHQSSESYQHRVGGCLIYRRRYIDSQ